MLLPPVNVSKSIKWHRLIYKPSIVIVFDYLFNLGFLLLAIRLSIFPFFALVHQPETILFACLLLLPGLWMLANALLLDYMIEIDGLDVNANRKDILTSLDQLLDGINTNRSPGNIIRQFKPHSVFGMGRVITVILDQEKVYLNIVSMTGRGLRSPFSGFYNYLKAKQVRDHFKILQENVR
jgi:hypothetical protein